MAHISRSDLHEAAEHDAGLGVTIIKACSVDKCAASFALCHMVAMESICEPNGVSQIYCQRDFE
jgi:hypothetical protein